MEDRLGEVNVPEVSRTLGHIPGAGLAPAGPVHGALSGVHEAPELGSAPLIHLGVPDAALGDAHPPDLLRTEDPELDPPDLFDRGLGVICNDRRHFDGLHHRYLQYNEQF